MGGFEQAGIDPAIAARESATGVFVGIVAPDYGAGLGATGTVREGYGGPATAASVASGRVAYTFGFAGSGGDGGYGVFVVVGGVASGGAGVAGGGVRVWRWPVV